MPLEKSGDSSHTPGGNQPHDPSVISDSDGGELEDSLLQRCAV